jgi:small-conductance mechanosensitive channel
LLSPEAQPSKNIDREGRMPIDLSNAWKSASSLVNTVISLLPNVILAIVIFIIFLLVASGARATVRRVMQRRERHQNLGLLFGHIAYVAVVIFGFLIALSAVAPSFRTGDLIKVLGIGSVAIGFAFQNILQNFLAGILLLLQEPFRIGDWITIAGFQGKVQDIQTRATVISAPEGQRIVIPNAVLFTNPFVVGYMTPKPGETKPAELTSVQPGPEAS